MQLAQMIFSNLWNVEQNTDIKILMFKYLSGIILFAYRQIYFLKRNHLRRSISNNLFVSIEKISSNPQLSTKPYKNRAFN